MLSLACLFLDPRCGGSSCYAMLGDEQKLPVLEASCTPIKGAYGHAPLLLSTGEQCSAGFPLLAVGVQNFVISCARPKIGHTKCPPAAAMKEAFLLKCKI